MADRDIEQAADHAAGRGDTIRPNPAMIDHAALAIARARFKRWDEYDVGLKTRLMKSALRDARAAAAVLVPATAEQIAAVYADRARRQQRSDGDYIDGCHGWHIADHYEQLAFELRKGDNPALGFTGLSAATPGGDSQ